MDGFFSRFKAAVTQPFPEDMGWTNLALVILFIIIVAAAWAQVIRYIATKVD